MTRKRRNVGEYRIPASLDERVRPSHEFGASFAGRPLPLFDTETSRIVQGHARLAVAKALKDPFEPPDTGGEIAEPRTATIPVCPRCKVVFTFADVLYSAPLGCKARCACGWVGTVKDVFAEGTRVRCAELLAELNHHMPPFSIRLVEFGGDDD